MSQLYDSSQALGKLYIRPMIDTDGGPLGWAVCVLIECGASNTTDKQRDTHVQQAELLILRHCADQDEAFSVKQGIRAFLRDEKMLAKFAFPREFWEWNASTQTESGDIRWIVIEGEALTAFRDEDNPLQCKREDWHPDLGS